MKYEELLETVEQGAALRYRCRLQPAGGPGDKVFPPTYEGGSYAMESRTINGEHVACVHLDSVQSQANRMELALLESAREDKFELPIIEVQFPTDDPLLKHVGSISHLEAPHRIADAILRDSEYEGVRFRESSIGAVLDYASIHNATGLFNVAPTSLIFGMWDSTGPLGGLGAKFPRVISSEIVGVGVHLGVKTASRIDPLGITLSAGTIYVENAETGEWSLEEKDPNGKKRTKVGKSGKPSEVNHGNVTPTISEVNGGVTFDYGLQNAVISLPALRRLRFPIETNDSDRSVDRVAHTALAAMAIMAVNLSIAKGLDLRSRSLLVPEAPATWEVVHASGETSPLTTSVDDSIDLYRQAIDQARSAGLPYRTEPAVLKPSKGLVELVRRSKEVTMESGGE